MIDPLATTMAAISAQSPTAFGLVFVAGVVTSFGPCVAPRYVALAAIVNSDRRPLVTTLLFVAGLVGALASLGFVAGFLGALWSISRAIYLILSIGLLSAGCITLVRASPHEHATHAQREPALGSERHRSAGGVFLLGAASALVISPCCTPIVAAVVATTTAIGKPLVGAELLVSFAAGHAVPLVFAGNVSGLVGRIVPRGAAQAPAIIGSVLMLALGIYYGLLA